MSAGPLVLLATFQLMPEGELGHAALDQALARRGVCARWATWDDPEVDWAAADLVAVRSTWDYHRRLDDFLSWARRVDRVTPVLNGPGIFGWNADKAYLHDLAETVPTVPTALLDDSALATGIAAALERWGAAVIKPRTGASGVGVVVVEEPLDARLEELTAGPWVVQPLVGSVRTEGERSVYVLAGRAVSQVDKLPAGAEIRVHELYGGTSRPVALDPELAAVAEAAVAAVPSVAPGETALPAYARVDLMRWDDAWAVSELELIEPGLYLDVAPGNAERFADLVVAQLGR